MTDHTPISRGRIIRLVLLALGYVFVAWTGLSLFRWYGRPASDIWFTHPDTPLTPHSISVVMAAALGAIFLMFAIVRLSELVMKHRALIAAGIRAAANTRTAPTTRLKSQP